MTTQSNPDSPCSKVGYSSTIEAHLALESIWNDKKIRAKTPTRYYRCQKCKKYHLTSTLNKGGRYSPDKSKKRKKNG